MKTRILLIDDSPDVHFVIEKILLAPDFELAIAESGPQGILLAQTATPDLILLDVDMPAQDGFEVCHVLKATAATSSIPIIFLTGASSSEEKVRGLGSGAVDYVTKPFDAGELKARINSALRTKQLIDELNQRALVDGLTKVWNRAYFDKALPDEVSIGRRHGRVLSCIIADIDKFKFINDTYGHPAGDYVLAEVAQLFQDMTRLEDDLSRIGGEEFAFLLPTTDETAAIAMAQRIRLKLELKSFIHDGRQIRVTCSFGVADTSLDPSPKELLENADKALYKAKQAGRNRVEGFQINPAQLSKAPLHSNPADRRRRAIPPSIRSQDSPVQI